MHHRILCSLLISGMSLTALACDEAALDADVELRAVTIKDRWGTYDPVHFPEVNSCYDYFNARCAEMSPQQCTVFKARYSCTESKVGVVITDGFTQTAAAAGIWFVATEGGPGKAASSPEQACFGLKSKQDRSDCLQLAKVAGLEKTVRALAPDGGIAPVLPLEQIDPDSVPLPDEDALVRALEPFEWTVPALGLAAREYVAGIVIEDIIMLIAPGGSSFYSNGNLILIHDARCTMDKVELCVDVDP